MPTVQHAEADLPSCAPAERRGAFDAVAGLFFRDSEAVSRRGFSWVRGDRRGSHGRMWDSLWEGSEGGQECVAGFEAPSPTRERDEAGRLAVPGPVLQEPHQRRLRKQGVVQHLRLAEPQRWWNLVNYAADHHDESCCLHERSQERSLASDHNTRASDGETQVLPTTKHVLATVKRHSESEPFPQAETTCCFLC